MKIDVHSSRTSTQSNQYSSQLNFPIFPRSSGTSSISLFNTPHHHHRAVMICGQAVQQWFVQQAHLQAQFNVIFKTDHLLPWAASGKTMPGIRESTTARNNRPSAITRIYPSIGSISFPFFPCCILSAMFPMIFCFLGYKAYGHGVCWSSGWTMKLLFLIFMIYFFTIINLFSSYSKWVRLTLKAFLFHFCGHRWAGTLCNFVYVKIKSSVRWITTSWALVQFSK